MPTNPLSNLSDIGIYMFGFFNGVLLTISMAIIIFDRRR